MELTIFSIVMTSLVLIAGVLVPFDSKGSDNSNGFRDED